MPDGYVLSPKSRNDFLRMVGRERSPEHGPSRDEPSPDAVRGEGGYIVRVPHGGLPALSEGANVETGTGTEVGDDVPGYAMCPAYRKVHPVGGTPYFIPLGFEVMVYNLSLVAVKAGRWLKVTRDRFGDYTYDNGLTPRSCTS